MRARCGLRVYTQRLHILRRNIRKHARIKRATLLQQYSAQAVVVMAAQENGGIESNRGGWRSSTPQPLMDRRQRTDSEIDGAGGGEETLKVADGSYKKLRFALRAVIAFVLFLVVLGCVTFSKLTLVALTEDLRKLTVDVDKDGASLFFVS